MKIIISIILLLSVVYASSEDLRINMESIEPQEPGSKFTIKLNIENPTDNTLNDIKITVEEDYPFIIDDTKEEISTLLPKETKSIYFDIDTKDDTESDTYSLKIKYQENNDDSEKETFSIKIQSKYSNIALTKISSSPEIIKQGEETELKLTIKNDGKTKTKNIRAKLDLTTVPFAPINGIENLIISLDQEEEEIINYKIKVLPDAESGTYKIPLSISYTNEIGDIQEKQELISVTIGSTPVIEITIEAEKPIILDELSTITILLTNSGLENIKLATIILTTSPDYNIISTNKVYIGNIDSDDYQTAEFTIIPKTTNPPKISLTFKDSNNKDFKIEETLETKIYTKEEAKKLKLITSKISTTTIIPIIIILLLIAYIIYKRRKRKND
ncbi:MAG TPA: hypothetical protein VJB89_00200 [Candidatus Nanoarchaeia archaeon]|nr:hypothetical protein [Candidatus Nanoarchaeia archaeon]